MKFRENPIFGRKVFFINPPFVIEKKVAEWLKELEYEVYIIKNIEDAKCVLRNYENAMCFINIDEDLSLRAWFNYIKSFEADPQLKSIFIGIMAHKTPEETVQKFVMNCSLPGGYIHLGVEPEEILKRFTGILELNGAKGNRKYLSLTCNNIDALTGYISYDSKLYSMTFENISSIGITCTLPNELSSILKKNTILDNVSLSLGRWSVITQCVVLSVKSLNNQVIAILLFTLNTPTEVKTSIRKFIYDVLNKRIYDIIRTGYKDTEDYTLGSNYGKEGAVPDFNAPTDEDKAEGGEALEEVTDEETGTEGGESKPENETKEEPEKADGGDETPAEEDKAPEAEEKPAEETKASETPEETKE